MPGSTWPGVPVGRVARPGGLGKSDHEVAPVATFALGDIRYLAVNKQKDLYDGCSPPWGGSEQVNVLILSGLKTDSKKRVLIKQLQLTAPVSSEPDPKKPRQSFGDVATQYFGADSGSQAEAGTTTVPT